MTGPRATRRLILAVEERRRRHRLTSAMARAVQPPPSSAFGAYGAGTVIAPPARVDNPQFMFLGARIVIHELAWLVAQPVTPGAVPRLVLEDDVQIQRFVKIVCAGEVRIGHGAFFADHVFVSDTAYRHDDPQRPIAHQGLAEPRPVRIGANVFLGFGSVVLPGITIGDYASVGAGAVVVADVPARGIVVGNPGRLVRAFDPASGTWPRVDDAGTG